MRRKPGSPRNEVDWLDEIPEPTFGHADGVLDSDGDEPHPLSVLWVPDVEKRRGWREFYVYPKNEKPHARKPLGFG